MFGYTMRRQRDTGNEKYSFCAYHTCLDFTPLQSGNGDQIMATFNGDMDWTFAHYWEGVPILGMKIGDCYTSVLADDPEQHN